MKLHLDKIHGNRIDAYDKKSITINEKNYYQSLIIMPDYISIWEIENFNQLTLAHFQRLHTLQPALVLLGTGQTLQFPNSELLQPLFTAQIGIEVMDSAAACRTYNILMAEGRRVLAALLLN